MWGELVSQLSQLFTIPQVGLKRKQTEVQKGREVSRVKRSRVIVLYGVTDSADVTLFDTHTHRRPTGVGGAWHFRQISSFSLFSLLEIEGIFEDF